MARPANQASGEGDTNRPVGGSRRPPKPKKSQLDRALGWDPSHLAAVLATAGLNVPDFQKLGRYQQGETFRQAYDAYKNRNDPGYFAQPQTLAQANLAADAATRLKYGGVEQALNQQITQTPQWYQNYKDSVAGAQRAAATYQQGLVDQSDATAKQIGQAVLSGIDPNSQAGQQDKQAAASRQALANLGTDLIRAGGAANDQYFGSRAGVADASQIAAMTKLLGQRTQLQGEKADYRTGVLGDLRTNAANQYLAQQTLGANVANQRADNAQAAANAAQTAADRKASRVVSRKNTRDRVAAANTKAAEREAKAAEKEAAKHSAAIHTATGKARNTVQDIRDAWARGGTVSAPTAEDPKATRKATRDELRHALGAKYGGTMVAIMERVRKRQALTSAQIRYLRDKYGPDFRVPSEWRGGRVTAGTNRPGNAPAQGGNRPT